MTDQRLHFATDLLRDWFEAESVRVSAVAWSDVGGRPAATAQLEASREVQRWKSEVVGGGFLAITQLGLPGVGSTKAYRSAADAIPLRRDAWAAALLDAWEDNGGAETGAQVVLEHGFVVAIAPGDRTSADRLLPLVAAVATRLEVVGADLPPMSGAESPPPLPSAFGSEQAWYQVAGELEGLAPGATAIRVHGRSRFGPESARRLLVAWPSATSSLRAWHIRPKAAEAEVLHDDDLVAHRFAAVIGAHAEAVEWVDVHDGDVVVAGRAGAGPADADADAAVVRAARDAAAPEVGLGHSPGFDALRRSVDRLGFPVDPRALVEGRRSRGRLSATRFDPPAPDVPLEAVWGALLHDGRIGVVQVGADGSTVGTEPGTDPELVDRVQAALAAWPYATPVTVIGTADALVAAAMPPAVADVGGRRRRGAPVPPGRVSLARGLEQLVLAVAT